MKLRKTAIAIAALALLTLTAAARAEGLDDVVSAAPEAAREAASEIESGNFDLGAILGDIVVKAFFGGEDPIKGAIKNAAAVFAASLLTALCAAFTGEGGGINASRLAGVLAVTAAAVGGMGSMIGSCERAMDELCAFSAALLPTMASASAVTGTAVSSAANFAAASLFMALMTSLTKSVIVPLVYAFVAASAASAAFGGMISSAVKLIKWAINTLLIVIATAFTLYLTITGAISARVDAAAVKLTRTAIGNLVPVVGRIIADASESVAAGLDALRSAAGVIGMIAIIAIAAGPVIKAAANHLAFKAAAALSEPIAGKEISALIGDIGTAMGFSMGTVGLCSAMLLVSVTVTLRATGV